ncbi:GntR family transcriptional regulator [Actinomadura harenae]|uniref:GntR family transcriptional regulator n=1 Tax=Actinomadura harenae TaxID=2483351 RepID=UPI001F3F8527|nr:GntR family transcriptional regulator [Actinomadura harenae]
MTSHKALRRGRDPRSDKPVFRQIADHLREAIQNGTLAPGDKLPSEAEFVAHYEVARMTVRSALQQLQTEGLVLSEHGRGVFVRPRPQIRRLASDRFARRHRQEGKAAFLAESASAGAEPTVDLIHVREEVADADIARRLGLATGEPVLVRSRRYALNGSPVETATSYIPARIARGTRISEDNPGPGGVYARLEDLGHVLGHFEEEVTARMPAPDEIEILQLRTGIPVFCLIRTAFDVTGNPVEVCDTILSSDVYVLTYDLPAR